MNGSFGQRYSQPGAGATADLAGFREAAAEIQRLRVSARHELDLARQIREEASRYQRETATRARSEAQQLLLQTRLATRREIEALLRQATEDVQKILADIRVIRITAEEELAALRKFTNAARFSTQPPAKKADDHRSTTKKKNQLAAAR
jgi:hypothetical protein